MSFDAIREPLKRKLEYEFAERARIADEARVKIVYDYTAKGTIQSSAYYRERVKHAKDELRERADLLLRVLQEIADAYAATWDQAFVAEAARVLTNQIDVQYSRVLGLLAQGPPVTLQNKALRGDGDAELAEERDRQRERITGEVELMGTKARTAKTRVLPTTPPTNASGSTDQLAELLDEYDEQTQRVGGASYQLYEASLRQWFTFLDSTAPFARTVLQLEVGFDFRVWHERVLKPAGDMQRHGGPLQWPDNPREYLAVRLGLCRAISRGQIGATDFALEWLSGSTNFNELTAAFSSQIFSPMAAELRRAMIRDAKQAPQPTGLAAIPASDRLVRLDHNGATYREALTALEETQRVVHEANDYEDGEDKAQREAELMAAIGLLKAPQVRADALTALLKPTLTFLATEFGKGLIAAAAATAFAAVGKLLGWF